MPIKNPLLNASQIFAELSVAFQDGTWDSVRSYAANNDLFERLDRKHCECCGTVEADPIDHLAALIACARSMTTDKPVAPPSPTDAKQQGKG